MLKKKRPRTSRLDTSRLQIEEGILIPEKRIRKTDIGEFVSRMKIGDSVWLESHRDAMAIWQAIVREHGGKGASLVRSERHPDFGLKGWRVWRVK